MTCATSPLAALTLSNGDHTKVPRRPRSKNPDDRRTTDPVESSPAAPVAQPAEATDSKPVQCAFESHRGHPLPATLSRPFTCEDAPKHDHDPSGSVRSGPVESG